MARKAGKSNDTQAAGTLIAAAGVLLFIPFLIISVISFSKLKNEYLGNEAVQRVVDIRRLLPSLITGGGVCAAGAFFINAYINEIIQKGISFAPVLIIISVGVSVLTVGYFLARRLAVMNLGVVADSSKNILVFPYDLQSYTITDYLAFRFVHDICNVDTVPLASIEKMTRGSRGKDLYLHGAFGSRGITMSSKQKRDECLAMVQSFAGKKGMLITEMEGY